MKWPLGMHGFFRGKKTQLIWIARMVLYFGNTVFCFLNMTIVSHGFIKWDPLKGGYQTWCYGNFWWVSKNHSAYTLLETNILYPLPVGTFESMSFLFLRNVISLEGSHYCVCLTVSSLSLFPHYVLLLLIYMFVDNDVLYHIVLCI